MRYDRGTSPPLTRAKPKQNYTQDCINNHACQQQNVNIDSASSVALYMLSTVAVEWMLSVNGAGVISQASNAHGFAETVTAWTSS